jgi:hypothetical protein
MRKSAITFIVISLLTGFYSFHIGLQVMSIGADVESLEAKIDYESIGSSEEIQYYLESIRGASGAANINTWLIEVFMLINLTVGAYVFYKDSKAKKPNQL